jgi:hypothetical protein
MQIDRRELENRYAQLSDEELLDLDRAELTQLAGQFYDAELARRRLTAEENESSAGSPGNAAPLHQTEHRIDHGIDEDAPDWLESAACAVVYATYPGGSAPEDADNARDVLAAAGIPCHIAVNQSDPNDPQSNDYSVMVPGARNLEAASVLAMQIDNPKEEASWRTHFEQLSDDDLRALKFEALCAGLQDRLARLKTAYGDEIARRK